MRRSRWEERDQQGEVIANFGAASKLCQ